MDYAGIASPGMAFAAGLVTSVHCAGMCGPLACVVMPPPGKESRAAETASAYHGARLAAYTLVGALGGGLGRGPIDALGSSWARWLPWAGVALFVGLAFRWDRHLPRLPALGPTAFRICARLRNRPVAAAAAIGFSTPLLPCAPLYFAAAVALLSGSAARGAQTMLAFGLGTVPLLWLAQNRLGWVQGRLSPVWTGRLRTGVALASALVAAWRLRGTLGLGPAGGPLVCF